MSASASATLSRASSVSGFWDSTAVRVAVRVRPQLTKERLPECIECQPDGSTLKLDLESAGPMWPMRGPPMRSFSFDAVYGPETSQQAFFDGCGVREMLDAALDGYTSTVFAFGQTGSGKTFTVSGKAADHRSGSSHPTDVRAIALNDTMGLMQRSAAYLYEGMASRPDVRFKVRATYLEIYNEQVVDLVEPSSGALGVRGSSRGGFYVEDLSVSQCANLRDLQYVISKGLENRHRVGAAPAPAPLLPLPPRDPAREEAQGGRRLRSLRRVAGCATASWAPADRRCF